MPGWEYVLKDYTNPLTIIGAISLVMAFSKLRVDTSRTINFISASAFAAFLLHASDSTLYQELMRALNAQYQGPAYVVTAAVAIIAIFAAAIILDQPRKWLWNLLSARFHKSSLLVKSA